MLVREVLQKTTAFFKEKGIESARLDTEILLSHALKWTRVQIYTNYEYPLNEKELEECRALVRRRLQGEPIAYILGERDFYKDRFLVAPGVLIPRPETEGLVEKAVQFLQEQFEPEDETFRIVDLGCGSGCVGLSILREFPNAHLVALDSSSIAVHVTKQNAERLGLTERAKILLLPVTSLTPDDLKMAFDGLADVVVANPPYIARDDQEVQVSVRKFEPPEALFADENGLLQIREWSQRTHLLLRDGGLALFEIGSDQGRVAHDIFSETRQYEDVQVSKDLAGFDRFIRAVKVRVMQN